MNKNITTFMGFDNDYKNSDIIVFGAPFDGTTSFRPGTRFAPMAMRIDSYGLETYSPYLDKDLNDIKVFDSGDLDLPFGNTNKVLDIIYNKSKNILDDNKIPFMIGGEHLISLPMVRAVYEKYNNLVLLHFDAHTDLRDNYLGENLSHASVIRRIWEFMGDNNIYQFGIRSGEKEEFVFASKHTILNKFNCNNIDNIINDIKDKPVYVTIDLDVLDPSIFPGTGTIEPGGITFIELIDTIKKLTPLNIVGSDIVELSPHYDISGTSTAVACKILRELVLSI